MMAILLFMFELRYQTNRKITKSHQKPLTIKKEKNMKNAQCLENFEDLDTWTFDESKPYQRRAQRLAATQFMNLYQKFQNLKIEDFGEKFTKWGFELETYHLKELSPEENNGCRYVEWDQSEYIKKDKTIDFGIDGEYLACMLELIPGEPFKNFLDGIQILDTFQHMRKTLYHKGRPGSRFFWGAVLPTIGTRCGLEARGFKDINPEELSKKNVITGSRYLDEKLIYSHPRYLTYTRNVLGRKKIKNEDFFELYKDENTDFKNVLPNETQAGVTHIDTSAFGPAQCSLQATFECIDIDQAQHVYDQLHFFTAIFQALAASTPTVKDKIVTTDNRIEVWESAINDERTSRERPIEFMAGQGFEKSRVSPFNYYISKMSKKMRGVYNDRRYTINIKQKRYLKKLAKERGLEIDEDLLNHVAYNLVRQAIHLTDESMLDQKEDSTDMFELFNGSNWNDLRFKPPPSLDSDIGWRVEFRSMDAQVNPEQNFLFCHAVLILFRLVTDSSLNLNFMVPISKVIY